MRRPHMTFEEAGEFAQTCYNASKDELSALVRDNESAENEIQAEMFEIAQNETTARGDN